MAACEFLRSFSDSTRRSIIALVVPETACKFLRSFRHPKQLIDECPSTQRAGEWACATGDGSLPESGMEGGGAALVQYEPSMIEVANQVINSAKPGDVIVLLGAGDVNSLAPVILDGLAERFI